MPKNMCRIKKKIFLFISILLVVTYPVTKALAEENSDKQEKQEIMNNSEVEEKGIFSTLYSVKYGDLSNGNSHYLLDIVPLDNEQMKAEENKSWWKRGWSFVNGSALKNEVISQIYELVNMVNNFLFQLNIRLTQFMLSTLNLAYEFNLIDQLIEKLQELMLDITGISGATLGNSGLFGSFAGVIAVLAVAYACYLYVWKRAAVESIAEMMKTVLTFAIALLFFSNYSAFLSGINQVTSEASQLILSGSVNDTSVKESNNTSRGTKEITLKEKMMDNVWTLFVDRPYLFMQYGTDDVDEIGSERIQELLTLSPGQGRQDYVTDKEVRAESNNMMTYGSVMERAVFTPLYLVVNGLCSIPVFLLALLLLVFQFWFMGIAAVAPFALLFAAIPGQFGVLKKYFVELGLPLVLKIIVSFGAIVVFAISEIVYNLNNIAVGGASEYIIVCVLQFILLALMFFLRNRIKNIFSAGSKEFQALRAEVGSLQEAVTRPVKTGVQNTATVAGAVVGGVIAGGAGVAAGANIGGKVGEIATGEGNIQSVTSGIGQVQMLSHLQGKHGNKKQLNEPGQHSAADPEQTIDNTDIPIGEQVSYVSKVNQDEDHTLPMEHSAHHEEPAEEMQFTNWSAPEQNENIEKRDSNQMPEDSAMDTPFEDGDDSYENLASLQHHIPPAQNEFHDEKEEAVSSFKSERHTESTEGIKDTGFYVNDNTYVPNQESAGYPILYPLEREETKKEDMETEKWTDDVRNNPRDYKPTEHENEQELYDFKTDTKRDE
ncbi:CD3337/EF1877 family mobilome membrane protein [Domibacillus indicus]|uniref:CD3337/EF1877 family mobilome membrane protein n=1 Tax=Domibacillus indicus TaxID=1437523 RepID=UPI000618234E|nr:hypothetical protein [Domibacillus indicus]